MTVGMIRILSGPGLCGYLNLSHAAYLPVAFLDPLLSVLYAALCPRRTTGWIPALWLWLRGFRPMGSSGRRQEGDEREVRVFLPSVSSLWVAVDGLYLQSESDSSCQVAFST